MNKIVSVYSSTVDIIPTLCLVPTLYPCFQGYTYIVSENLVNFFVRAPTSVKLASTIVKLFEFKNEHLNSLFLKKKT